MTTNHQHWQGGSSSCLRLYRPLGEDRVEFWHGTDEGFAGRRPLASLPDGAARA